VIGNVTSLVITQSFLCLKTQNGLFHTVAIDYFLD
jgi:hypothetical protein